MNPKTSQKSAAPKSPLPKFGFPLVTPQTFARVSKSVPVPRKPSPAPPSSQRSVVSPRPVVQRSVFNLVTPQTFAFRPSPPRTAKRAGTVSVPPVSRPSVRPAAKQIATTKTTKLTKPSPALPPRFKAKPQPQIRKRTFPPKKASASLPKPKPAAPQEEPKPIAAAPARQASPRRMPFPMFSALTRAPRAASQPPQPSKPSPPEPQEPSSQPSQPPPKATRKKKG
jgi:hypothetical protein